MSVLYGAAQGVNAIKAEAYANHQAKASKFYLMSGGQYLHQQGQHLQVGTRYAWQGTIEQARACRAKFDAAAGCKTVAVEG